MIVWALAYRPLAVNQACWDRECWVERHEVAADPVYDIPMIFEDEQYRERNTLVRVSDVRTGLSVSPGRLYCAGGNRGLAKAEIHGELGIATKNHLCLLDEGIV